MNNPRVLDEKGIGRTIQRSGPASRARAARRLAWTFLFALVAAAPARAEPLTYTQVLQRTVDKDAALQIARLEFERARLETIRVESQLGWIASSQAGVAHQANVFGVPADRTEARADVERRLESGSSVGVGVGAAYEDSETALIPFLPNPSQSVNVDANYRLPLAQGSENVSYRQGLVTADAGIEAAQAEWGAVRNQLAAQVAELFYAAALTYARLRNAGEAIARAERLRDFVLRNVRLGVAEAKDRLQAEAQLRARLTEQRALQATWENQRITLNRLMERAWQSDWQPRVEERPSAAALDVAAIQAQAAEYSPELQRDRARMRIAEATIAQRRDAGRDQVDLVFSVGQRRLTGDIPGGRFSESEPVAGVRLEYRAALDRRGADATLTQAYLERDAARRRMEANLTDLQYDVARLVAEIEAVAEALAQARARKEAERRKLDEATRRYRTARADTAELIQFENDYEAATLAVEQQTIELARRYRELDRLRGAAWNDITFPPAGVPERSP